MSHASLLCYDIWRQQAREETREGISVLELVTVVAGHAVASLLMTVDPNV